MRKTYQPPCGVHCIRLLHPTCLVIFLLKKAVPIAHCPANHKPLQVTAAYALLDGLQRGGLAGCPEGLEALESQAAALRDAQALFQLQPPEFKALAACRVRTIWYCRYLW